MIFDAMMRSINPTYLAFFGAVVVALAALLTAETKKKSDLEKSAREAEFQKKYAEQANELSKKSDEIAKLNRELLNSVTGAEGYAKFEITTPGNGRYYIRIFNDTPYPLFDLIVIVRDPQVQRAKNLERGQAKDFFEALQQMHDGRTQINVGTLAPSVGRSIFNEFSLPQGANEYALDFELIARNRTVFKHIVFRKIEGVWRCSHSTLANDNTQLELYDEFKFLPENLKGTK